MSDGHNNFIMYSKDINENFNDLHGSIISGKSGKTIESGESKKTDNSKQSSSLGKVAYININEVNEVQYIITKINQGKTDMDTENKDEEIFYKIININNEKEINNDIDILLLKMDCFGQIIKKEIESVDPSNFLTSEDAFKNVKVLAVLQEYLKKNGCTCEIEKERAKDEKDKREAFTAIQFITNGMYKFKKYIFQLKNGYNEKKFKDLLKNLSILLEIDTKDIILNTTFLDSGSLSAIIKNPKHKKIDISELQSFLIQKVNIDIDKIEETILLNGCRINEFWIDDTFKEDDWTNIKQKEKKRGGLPYYKPIGWKGYRIKISDRYDKGNKDWLEKRKGWGIAYHCINMGINQEYKNSNDEYHNGQKVGEGICVTPKDEGMEVFLYTYANKKYKLGIMCRVNPDKVRCHKDFWIINGTDDQIRPCRFLLLES